MDINNYKEAFLEETEEHINILNNTLLEFEKNPDDLSYVNKLFRSAHTLKGMSATMGYNKLTHFTHLMEDILDKIRNGEIKPDKDIIDTLFKSIDVIEEFIYSIKTSNIDVSKKSDEVINYINSYLKPAGSSEVISLNKDKIEEKKGESFFKNFNVDDFIIKEAKLQNLLVYKIKIELDEGCAFKNVRAFMINRNLSSKGEIVRTYPSAKDLEEGKFDNEIFLIYVSKLSKEEIEKILYKIAEIKNVIIEKIEEKVLSTKKDKKEDEEKIISRAQISQNVKVNIEKLDALMNLIGELVIIKMRVDQIIKEKTYEKLIEAIEEFDRVIDELQMEITNIRMLPISHIFERYPRVVRDLAKEFNKIVELEISGGDIEIDRTVLEEINEPILHLIRNSIAHGIEYPEEREKKGKSKKGVIHLNANRERNSIIIEVRDDGKGIDVEKVRKKAVEKGIISEEKIYQIPDEDVVNLIALPGFSTADKIDKISGRGVGVDVVKTKVESFGGIFKIENYPGEGVKFILKLPVTLAIIQALLVYVDKNIYAIPVIHVLETVEIEEYNIKIIQGKKVIILRDEVIPIISLRDLFNKPKNYNKELIEFVIIEVHDKKIALEVDYVIGQQEIAIKSLGEFSKYAKGFSGVTILGDGKISLIIDIQNLLETQTV